MFYLMPFNKVPYSKVPLASIIHSSDYFGHGNSFNCSIFGGPFPVQTLCEWLYWCLVELVLLAHLIVNCASYVGLILGRGLASARPLTIMD